MTKIEPAMVQNWTGRAAAWLAERNLTAAQVLTGSDAWTIAHALRIPMEAYDISRNVTDAHIKTALAKIFPNAIFKDAYRY